MNLAYYRKGQNPATYVFWLREVYTRMHLVNFKKKSNWLSRDIDWVNKSLEMGKQAKSTYFQYLLSWWGHLTLEIIWSVSSVWKFCCQLYFCGKHLEIFIKLVSCLLFVWASFKFCQEPTLHKWDMKYILENSDPEIWNNLVNNELKV